MTKEIIKRVLLPLLMSLAVFLTFSQTVQADSLKQKYVIGTDITYAPFEFQNDAGQYVGIDLDLLKKIAKNQGFELEIKPLGFNAAVQALDAGQVDAVMAGMTITAERKEKFDFTDSYFDSGIVMAIAENDTKIKAYKDLKGQTVAIKVGTEAAMFAKKIATKYDFKVKEFDDSNNMYNDVTAGNSVATFEDYPVIGYAIKNGLALKTVTEPEKGGQYGVAVKKGQDAALVTAFNTELAKMKKDGSYQKIIDTYISTSDAAKATTVKEDRRFLGLIKANYQVILKGLGETLTLTFISIFFAAIIGIIFGLMSVFPNKFLRIIAAIYVDVMRGIPLMVLALYFYMGLPGLTGHSINDRFAAILTLSLNAGAYVAELVRGGINAVPKGQLEAAESLGLPYGKAMLKIVLPQAVKIMIPSFINQFVITLKDTSILSVIGLTELTQTGKIIIARNMEGNKIWTIIALTYLIIILLLTRLAKMLERKFAND